MIALLAVAMAADLVTFALAVPAVGIEAEQNPILAAAYASAGLLPVVIVKAAATGAIAWALLRISRPLLRRLTAVLAIEIALLGALGNTVTWAVTR